MIGIVSALVGITGMVALWWLAWRLWKQAIVVAPPSEPGYRAPVWQNEPTPEHRVTSPPPSWLFTDAQAEAVGDAAPVGRERPSSSAHTSFFVRDDLERAHANPEKTEILDDDEVPHWGPAGRRSPPPPPPPPKNQRKSRKTWLYSGPRQPGGG